MKKIFLYTIIFLTSGILFSCSNSSSSDSDYGFVDPGDWSGKDVAVKSFDLPSYIGICSSSVDCLAIIYHGELDDVKYTGIAVDNGANTLKIYWRASSFPAAGTETLSSCTVVYNGTTKTTGVDINVTVSTSTSNNHTVYNITFNTISPAAPGISTTESISAVRI